MVTIFGHQITKLDLLVLVGILSRLLIYVSWDTLSLVDVRKFFTNSLNEYVDLVYDQYHQLIGEARSRVKLYFKRAVLLLFETEDLRLKMEDLKKRLVCGTGLTSPTLGRVHIDNACVVVHGGTNQHNYSVLTQISECYSCSFITSWASPADKDNLKSNLTAENSFQVNTRYFTSVQVHRNDEVAPLCSTDYKFDQYGLYNLSLDNCGIKVEDRPSNAYIPLFWAFVVLCLLAGLRLTFQALYKTSAFRRFLVWISLRTEIQNDLTSQFSDAAALLETADAQTKRSRRLRSLDAFRGFSLSLMIFVNYGGGNYYFFNHSPWNGLTVADLLFPWFIWIMGVSLVISTQSQLRNSRPRSRIVRKVLIRSGLLVLLGIILNSDGGRNDLRRLRLPGVLQRFGVSYLVVGLAEATLTPREFPHPESRGNLGWMLEITTSGWQWFLTFFAGGLHAAVTFLMPVPGCPKGYLGPGGLSENGTNFNCTGGAAMWVDYSVFGREHIYQTPTCNAVYRGTAPYDPEGLLGTLNSIVLVWLGVAAGRVLLVHSTWQGRIKRWLALSLLTGLIAGVLCGFSKNEGLIPVNKNLWSLSFILATASFAFLLLSLMYLLIDVFNFWSGSPFHFPGMNSILVYIGHEMVSGMLPWSWKPFSESHAELLAMNMWGAGLWILSSYVLFKKRVFFAL